MPCDRRQSNFQKVAHSIYSGQMTDWVNRARTMSICEFTPRRVDRSWSRPRPTMVAALIGPVYTRNRKQGRDRKQGRS